MSADDEDLDSDEAFNSEDERQFGGAFKAGKRDSQYDDDAQSDAGEVEGEKETISALFSSITHNNGGDDDDASDEDGGDDGEDDLRDGDGNSGDEAERAKLLASIVGGRTGREGQQAAVARAAAAFSHSGSGASGITIGALVDSLQGQSAHGALQARFDAMQQGGAALAAPTAR